MAGDGDPFGSQGPSSHSGVNVPTGIIADCVTASGYAGKRRVKRVSKPAGCTGTQFDSGNW